MMIEKGWPRMSAESDSDVRRLAAALIRAGNMTVLRGDETDEELMFLHGTAATPLARAFIDVIRAEVRAALAEKGPAVPIRWAQNDRGWVPGWEGQR